MKPAISSLDLIRWQRWIEVGKDDKEKEERRVRVQKYLFPPDLTEDERKDREETVDFVKKFGRPPSFLGFSDPCPPPDDDPNAGRIPLPDPIKLPEAPPAPPEPEWQGLIPKDSKAYRRGSLHDGTHQEMRRMRDSSKGSPFDVNRFYDAEDEKAKPKKTVRRSLEIEKDEED